MKMQQVHWAGRIQRRPLVNSLDFQVILEYTKYKVLPVISISIQCRKKSNPSLFSMSGWGMLIAIFLSRLHQEISAQVSKPFKKNGRNYCPAVHSNTVSWTKA